MQMKFYFRDQINVIFPLSIFLFRIYRFDPIERREALEIFIDRTIEKRRAINEITAIVSCIVSRLDSIFNLYPSRNELIRMNNC